VVRNSPVFAEPIEPKEFVDHTVATTGFETGSDILVTVASTWVRILKITTEPSAIASAEAAVYNLVRLCTLATA
jgi:hypothetical protein